MQTSHVPSATETPLPTLVLVMGVSGTGKSTLARKIADHYHFTFIDADDFHSEESKTRMSQGHALSEAMREPWINKLSQFLRSSKHAQRSCVLAFSGLRKTHRQTIFSAGFDNLIIYLHGDTALIEQRINQRANHFMPATLLASQIDAMEPPEITTNVFALDVSTDIDTLFNQSLSFIHSMNEK